MRKTPTIYRIVAFLMLIIFSFSITPKRYLHSLIAGHTDCISKIDNHGKAAISKKEINCDCNSIVATAPYIVNNDIVQKQVLKHYSSYNTSIADLAPQYSCVFEELRGPPSVG